MHRSWASTHFELLDVLRGLAAIAVLVYHFIELFKWHEFPVAGPLALFRAGWIGVDLFFVISGFVIGLSAFSGIDRHGNWRFQREFLRRRLLRIVPLHYLTMAVFVIFVVPDLLFANFLVNLMSHLLFVHNFRVDLHGGLNGSNWSLGTEMQFYLLMLVLAPWLRVGRWWVMALIWVAVAWAWRFGVTLWVQPTPALGHFPVFVAATQLPGMADEFLGGLLVARLVRSDRGRRWLNRLSERGRVFWYSVFAIYLLLTLVLSVYWRHAGFWDHPMMVIFWRTFLALAFSGLLFVLLSIRLVGVWKRILAPPCYLGSISYGIYLWHLPVLLSLRELTWSSPGQALAWGMALTGVLAAASCHFFERPIVGRPVPAWPNAARTAPTLPCASLLPARRLK